MKIPVLTLLGAFLLLVDAPHAAETIDVSPHWDKSACITCHYSPQPTDSSDLRSVNQVELCAECHNDSTTSACAHPTNVPALIRGQGVLPEPHRSALAGDRIVCTTCHSMAFQCKGGSREQYQNPAFLRSEAFRHASDACFDCHHLGRYKKLNPHQAKLDGETQSCLFCHNDVPDAEKGTSTGTRLSGNLQCTGCHRVEPHPLSMVPGTRVDEWTHLVVPTDDIVNRMQAAEDRTGIKLPLDPDDGAVTCSTCHNPHEPGLATYPHLSEEGAVSRLRMLDICEACHDK